MPKGGNEGNVADGCGKAELSSMKLHGFTPLIFTVAEPDHVEQHLKSGNVFHHSGQLQINIQVWYPEQSSRGVFYV